MFGTPDLTAVRSKLSCSSLQTQLLFAPSSAAALRKPSQCADESQNLNDILTNSTDISTNSIDILENSNDILSFFRTPAVFFVSNSRLHKAQHLSMNGRPRTHKIILSATNHAIK
jgi:hypothetical protein